MLIIASWKIFQLICMKFTIQMILPFCFCALFLCEGSLMKMYLHRIKWKHQFSEGFDKASLRRFTIYSTKIQPFFWMIFIDLLYWFCFSILDLNLCWRTWFLKNHLLLLSNGEFLLIICFNFHLLDMHLLIYFQS